MSKIGDFIIDICRKKEEGLTVDEIAKDIIDKGGNPDLNWKDYVSYILKDYHN